MRRKTLEKMEKIQLVLLSVFIVILLTCGAMILIKGKEVLEVLSALEDRVASIETVLKTDKLEVETEEPEKVEVKYNILTPETTKTIEVVKEEMKYIEILSPKHNQKITSEPIVFTGKVSPKTTKIVANALVISKLGQTNNAVYTLEDFELGDQTFSYTSKEEWNNLVDGINTYTFTAYFEDGTYESTSITIYFEKKKAIL
ncbi:hypothetical protein ACFL21_02595 [Patescibacteria group bacterium]